MIRSEFVGRIKKALGVSKLNALDARVTSNPTGKVIVLLEVAPNQKQVALIVQAVSDSMLEAHKEGAADA